MRWAMRCFSLSSLQAADSTAAHSSCCGGSATTSKRSGVIYRRSTDPLPTLFADTLSEIPPPGRAEAGAGEGQGHNLPGGGRGEESERRARARPPPHRALVRRARWAPERLLRPRSPATTRGAFSEDSLSRILLDAPVLVSLSCSLPERSSTNPAFLSLSGGETFSLLLRTPLKWPPCSSAISAQHHPRSAGKFVRRFQLPRTVDPTRPIQAAVSNGVLTVSVPKLDPAKVPPRGEKVAVDVAWGEGEGGASSAVPVSSSSAQRGKQQAAAGGGGAAAPPMPTTSAGGGEQDEITGVGHPEPLREHTGVVMERVVRAEEPDSELPPVTYGMPPGERGAAASG